MTISKRETGSAGEDAAAAYLERHGYAVLARNYTSGHIEIDIICRMGEDLVFVEVKTRAGTLFGTPAMAVDMRKQRRIIRCAAAFIAENGQYGGLQPRFDIAEVFGPDSRGAYRINHIESAFIAESEDY